MLVSAAGFAVWKRQVEAEEIKNALQKWPNESIY